MLRVFFSLIVVALAHPILRGEEVALVALPARSTVYAVRSDAAIDNYICDSEVVRRMVDALVVGVTGRADTVSAWKSLVKPGDRVGIKVSAAGGRYFSSHLPVVEAIVAGLESAGVSRERIVVWDRADMRAAGFRTGAGYQVRRIASAADYEPGAIFSAAILGKLIWGDLEFTKKGLPSPKQIIPEDDQLSNLSHWSTVLCREVTKIINVPVMSGAESCGIAGCIYNITVPNVDNWRRFTSSPDFGNPFLCELYADMHVAPKVVLNVMDGLVAQYAGGPEFEPGYAFHHRTLYAGKDPVAIDATALREMEIWRAQSKLPQIGERAAYLKSAEAMGLGIFSADRIEVKQVILPQ